MRKQTLADHQKIVDALSKRDRMAARQAMLDHLDHVEGRLIEILESSKEQLVPERSGWVAFQEISQEMIVLVVNAQYLIVLSGIFRFPFSQMSGILLAGFGVGGNDLTIDRKTKFIINKISGFLYMLQSGCYFIPPI